MFIEAARKLAVEDQPKIISTRRRNLDSGIRNADIEFQETATDQSLFPEVISSNTPHTGPVTSLGQGAEA